MKDLSYSIIESKPQQFITLSELNELDSVTSDNNGRFSVKFFATGQYVDYCLRLEQSEESYINDNETNYITDRKETMFKFNYSTLVTNAVVKGRELNYVKLHLKVAANPFDSFFIRTELLWANILVKGQSIDTVITLRHLPGEQTIIHYYTYSLRDTAGLAALNSRPAGHMYSVGRRLADTINATMSDTIFADKTIDNSLSMPRW